MQDAAGNGYKIMHDLTHTHTHILTQTHGRVANDMQVSTSLMKLQPRVVANRMPV